MKKSCISEEKLYIKKVIDIIKAENTNYNKLLTVDARHSDAFVYILGGNCSYKFEGGKHFTAKEGDILYLARGAHYDMIIRDERYKFIFCDFEFESGAEYESSVFTSKNPSYTENLFVKLLNVNSQNSPSSFTDTLSVLYSIYGHIKSIAQSEYAGGGIMERIRSAKEVIETSLYDTELSISNIAENIGISEVYFRKLFRAEYGLSPSRFITSERIKRAKELMRYPFLSLSECAKESGFSSLQYFCRVFKKEMGITPAKYREQV